MTQLELRAAPRKIVFDSGLVAMQWVETIVTTYFNTVKFHQRYLKAPNGWNVNPWLSKRAHETDLTTPQLITKWHSADDSELIGKRLSNPAASNTNIFKDTTSHVWAKQDS
jgi:hypothetical protein